jgi:hypothetical protein
LREPVDKRVLVVAAEAAAVWTIFERYLELGSVRALAADLDRRAAWRANG